MIVFKVETLPERRAYMVVVERVTGLRRVTLYEERVFSPQRDKDVIAALHLACVSLSQYGPLLDNPEDEPVQ